MRVPFGEWTPDLPAVGVNQLRKALNVLARDAQSYVPFPSLTETFDALPERVTGVYVVQETDLTVRIFCGTKSFLYTTTSGPAWTDVSKVGDYTSVLNPWNFTDIDYRVFATNYEDPIQTWLLGTDTVFSDLAAAAPKARYATSWFPGFLVVAGTNDATDGERPNRVWWPAYGDPTDWPVPGSAAAEAVQSDFRDLSKGGAITGLTGPVGGASGSVFCQRAIYRADYEGPPTIFRVVDVETDRGTNAPNSLVNIGTHVFYLGDNGFYVFDGAQSAPIGSRKIDKTFYDKVHQGFLARVFGVADPINKIVMWLYPTNETAGVPNMVIAYNWEIGRWTEAEVNAELLAQFYTPSYTIDSIDGFGDIDTIVPSLDSRFWLGGSKSLVAFTPDHKLGLLSGDHQAATLETGDYFNANCRSVLVGRVTPHADGGVITVSSGRRDVQDSTESNITYSTPAVAESDGTHLVRTRGKYQRIRVEVEAGSSWRTASGVDVTVRDGGRR